MAVLYVGVCSLPVTFAILCLLESILDALSWNVMCCVCLEGSEDCACINELSLTIRLEIVGVSSHIQCLYFFWSAACRQYSYHLCDRYSESSPPMPALPLLLTLVPCRGECDSLPASGVTHDFPRCESPCSAWDEVDHWLDSSGWTIYILRNWMSFLVFTMLSGKLGTYKTSMILTWLKRLASHHHYSVACHVSTIQKDLDLSHCLLPGCQHFRRICRRIYNDACLRRYA